MKRFIWTVWVSITVLSSIIYLLACLSPLIPADQWVIMGFLGLGFPVLFVGEVILMITWLFISRKAALILLLVTLVGSCQIWHSIAFHPTHFTQEKALGNIRLLCWNVQNFNSVDIWHDGYDSKRQRIFRYIKNQQADIVCLQDFYESESQYIHSNVGMMADSLGFKYYAFFKDNESSPPWGIEHSGVAVFSKFPLHNVRRIPYPLKRFPESILTTDVTVGQTTRRLVVTHLQSMHLKNLPLSYKKPWIRDEDSLINYSNPVYRKLSSYFPYHAEQARLVRKVLDESPYPVIFSADMNEVPTSYCYRKIKGNLTDVFLKKGNGLGRTYYRISPTLRIDYIFTSPSITITQYKKDETGEISDHYPQVADVEW